MNISKKPTYPFELFSALFAENRQKSNKEDDKTSIKFTVTCNISTLHTENNFVKFWVCSESILLVVVL